MTDTDETDDTEESGCGYEWDHTLVEIDRRDGFVMLMCRECEAEIVEEPDEED